MTSKAFCKRAAGRRRTGLLVLAAIFWVAQLHGLSHLVSHLGRDHAAPHSLVCGDCVASADAGAAPVSSIVVPALVAPTAPPPVHVAPSRHLDRLLTAYRSRAPPSTPI